MKQRRRRRNVSMVGACRLPAVAAVVMVVLLVASCGGKTLQVPDVLGLTYKEARKRVESANLVIEIDPRQDYGDKDAVSGKEVIGQDPRRGESARKGTLVTVILKGVPDKSATVNSSPGTTPEVAESNPPPPSTQATQPAQSQTTGTPALLAPVDGKPLYPFTQDASIACGHWESGSQDYPYFGAPRDGNSRTHAGIDIYPAGGEGTPVKAMKDGTVVKVASFYTRANGEVTYGVLVDHGDFVADYAELKPPQVAVGITVKQGQVIGAVSGTEQLHFEMYDPGSKDWTSGWYGTRPANLRDPTQMMLDLGL